MDTIIHDLISSYPPIKKLNKPPIQLPKIEKKDIRNHALLLISKFIELLKSLDEIVFNKQIEKLEEILEKNIN